MKCFTYRISKKNVSKKKRQVLSPAWFRNQKLISIIKIKRRSPVEGGG
jgi:hypothetical protein